MPIFQVPCAKDTNSIPLCLEKTALTGTCFVAWQAVCPWGMACALEQRVGGTPCACVGPAGCQCCQAPISCLDALLIPDWGAEVNILTGFSISSCFVHPSFVTPANGTPTLSEISGSPYLVGARRLPQSPEQELEALGPGLLVLRASGLLSSGSWRLPPPPLCALTLQPPC